MIHRSLAGSIHKDSARTHTVKVRDDFIEDPETLDASVVDALLSIEIREVWDRGKHHAYFIVGLTVQLLSVKDMSDMLVKGTVSDASPQ